MTKRIGTALALIATATTAHAQSNLASEMPGQRDSRVRVGVVVPLGSAGTKSERAARFEVWQAPTRVRDITVLTQAFSREQVYPAPVRIGLTFSNQPTLVINGREAEQQDGRAGISTLGVVGIVVGVVVITGALALSGTLGDCITPC